jgi:hypothetical protein
MGDKENILSVYLTPCIPLSMIGIPSLHEGEDYFLKGLRPFKLPLINNLRYAIIPSVGVGI